MTFTCNEGHIAIIYGSQPCPLCACFKRIGKLQYEKGLLKGKINKALKRAGQPADFDSEGVLDDVIEILRG